MPDFMKLMSNGGGASLQDQLAQLIQSVNELKDATLALKQQNVPAVLTEESLWDIINGPSRSTTSVRAHALIFSADQSAQYGLQVGNGTILYFLAAAYQMVSIPLGTKGLAIGRGQKVGVDTSQASSPNVQAALVVTVEPGYDTESRDYA